MCGYVLTLSRVLNLLRIGTYLVREPGKHGGDRQAANLSFFLRKGGPFTTTPPPTHTPKDHRFNSTILCVKDVVSFTQRADFEQ